MNNQKPQKKDVSIFQEKTSRQKQKASSIFKKIPRMEIKPSNSWRILKIGPSSKRIKKRKKMSDVATALSNKKYLLDHLRKINFDKKYNSIAFTAMEDEDNSNKPIIIEDDDDEESSDSEYEHKKVLIHALYSLMQRVDLISLKPQRKPKETTFKDQKMQAITEKENLGEQNLPTDLEGVPSPQNPASIHSSTPNTNENYEKPQTPQTNEENTVKEHFDENATIQSTPKPYIAFEDKYNALRTLLESPTTPPKKRYKHYEPETIAKQTAGGVPMDLRCSSQNVTNEKARNILNSQIQAPQPSCSHENRIYTNLNSNPQVPDHGEFSGGHSRFQQANSPQVDNTTKLAKNLSVESGSSQSEQKIQRTSAVTNSDVIISANNTNQNTPIDTQVCPDSSQQYQQFNLLQSPNPLTLGNTSNLEAHPQIVAKYIFQQFYPQNNANNTNHGQNYLQSTFLQPPPFLPQPGNFNQNLTSEGYPPELLYWAQIGMGMWARENMTQIIPSGDNHPIQYSPYQVPSEQDMQSLQITEGVNIVQQNQSVIENISQSVQLESVQLESVQLDSVQLDSVQLEPGQLDSVQLDSVQLDSVQLDSVQLESVQNSTEKNILLENIIESDSTPCTIDVPTDNLNVSNYTEESTNVRMDKSTNSQSSEGALNVSVNIVKFTEFMQELDDLFEQLKLSMKTINSQLKNVSLFNNGEIMDEVMNGVHGYCTQRNTNVSASTSQNALTANRRVNKREHGYTFVDSCYDDDEIDEDTRTDSDEDYYYERQPKRKRTIKISFTLPPEYDANDTRWVLRYRGEGLGIGEIMPGSNVYVNERRVMYCKTVAKTSNALATMLLVEIFSYNALTVCSLTGGKATAYKVEGDKVRPGLAKNALETLMACVEQHADAKGWPKVSRSKIVDSLRFKLKSMRENALKFKE